MRDPAPDRYQGHLPDGSGIQCHSVGGLYPYVIYAQSHGDLMVWGYIAPGQPGVLIGDYSNACAAAEMAKLTAAAQKQAAINDEILRRTALQWAKYQTSRNRVHHALEFS